MPAKSKSQQRFFGMVRAAQKGEMKNPSKEVSDVASDISMKDAKKFAKTKHKGLPEKKIAKEEVSMQESFGFKDFRAKVKKMKDKQPEKAMDAGAKARRILKRKEHAKYVSGSTENVPDDIRDHYEVSEGKKKGLWDNIHAKRKRGEKPAKPGDKDYPKTLNVEGAAWTKKSGKNPEGGLNEKGRKSYERENPGSDLKAPQPEGGPRKKSFCARMKGMRKRQKPSNNTGKDRLSLSLKKWKCNEEKISAFDFVKKKIEKEVGKSGYVSKDNPRKPQSAADKAKARAHQAKVDKENAAARAKDPSQGRYPKG